MRSEHAIKSSSIAALDCEQCLFSSKILVEERKTSSRASVPVSAARVSENERKERLHWFHSYNDLDARHSGDGEILLVGLRSYDAHLSVTFIL